MKQTWDGTMLIFGVCMFGTGFIVGLGLCEWLTGRFQCDTTIALLIR